MNIRKASLQDLIVFKQNGLHFNESHGIVWNGNTPSCFYYIDIVEYTVDGFFGLTFSQAVFGVSQEATLRHYTYDDNNYDFSVYLLTDDVTKPKLKCKKFMSTDIFVPSGIKRMVRKKYNAECDDNSLFGGLG